MVDLVDQDGGVLARAALRGRIDDREGVEEGVDDVDHQQEVVEVETVNGFGPNDVILDIRSIDEQEDKPLKVEGIDVVSLPFYKLSTKFGDLDQNKTWLLWCERGVMSRLQALYLREQGFNNVKVYRP